MPELSQFEKDGVVYDFKDTTARGMIPFVNLKTNLVVDMTISKDEDGNLPTYVEITQRDDGTPLNLRAFIVKTDVKANDSYTMMGVNDLSWMQSFPITHGSKTYPNTYIITGEKAVAYVSNGIHPVGSPFQNGNAPAIESVEKLRLPEKTQSMSAGTFIKIWEITGG